jgi:para-nitrobenzyl esterase
MKSTSRAALAVAAVCAFVSACAKPAPEPEAPPKPAAETLRTTAEGDVVGFVGDNGVQTWRGVPFAAPPIGDLRWRAPRPPAAWKGWRETLSFSAKCPQLTNVFNAGEGAKPGDLQGSEDCLYLNVYAPPKSTGSSKLPVMVFIHGGGNVWGSASQYDPSNLALNENVVVVTVQYRLGPLGWFAHEAIRDGAAAPLDRTANFGTLDLVAALQWVRANIEVFGGDPALVTIFGESAGGQNVATLLASPLARGLFSRAIIQSGLFDSTPLDHAENGETEANAARKAADRAGAKTADELRGLSLEALYAAYELDGQGYLTMPLIIADGVALPEAGLRAAFATKDGFNAVPIITGTNRDEMKLFQFVDPRLVNRWFGVLLSAKNQKFYDRLAEYQSRLWRIRSVDEPASAMAAADHLDVYAYRFDWDEGGRFLTMDLKKLLGAAHAIEIPFVFNRFRLLGRLDAVMFQEKDAAAREELSRAMGAYWAAFARDGDPGTGGEKGLAHWPRWRTGGGTLMRLDAGARDLLTGADSVDQLIADLAADRALSAKERTIVTEALGVWLPERKADFAAAAAR